MRENMWCVLFLVMANSNPIVRLKPLIQWQRRGRNKLPKNSECSHIQMVLGTSYIPRFFHYTAMSNTRYHVLSRLCVIGGKQYNVWMLENIASTA